MASERASERERGGGGGGSVGGGLRGKEGQYSGTSE